MTCVFFSDPKQATQKAIIDSPMRLPILAVSCRTGSVRVRLYSPLLFPSRSPTTIRTSVLDHFALQNPPPLMPSFATNQRNSLTYRSIAERRGGTTRSVRRRESDGHQSAGPKASLRTVPTPYLAHLRGGHRESREEAASGNNHMVDSEPVGPRSRSRDMYLLLVHALNLRPWNRTHR